MTDNLEAINKKLTRSSNQFQSFMKSALQRQTPLLPPKMKNRKSSDKQFSNYENPEDSTFHISVLRRTLVNDKPVKMPQIVEPSHFQKTSKKFYTPQKSRHYNDGYLPSNTKFSVQGRLYNQEKSPKTHKNAKLPMTKSIYTTPTKISQIDHNLVLEHINNHHKLLASSKPEEIFDYFCGFVPYMRKPLIKKFKNCLFFGDPQPNSSPKKISAMRNSSQPKHYQGFLYFYNNKLYYGDFFDQHKHGNGVQINLNTNTVYRGVFQRGHKNGKFQVFRQCQKFEGYLSKGKYHGQGKLTTDISIYTGTFYQGERHGKGEQYFFKSGLKLVGQFYHNKFSNQIKNSSSMVNKSSDIRNRKKHVRFNQCSNFNNDSAFEYSYHESSESEEKEFRPNLPILKHLNYIRSESVFDMKKQQQQQDGPLPSPFRRFGLRSQAINH